MDVVIGIQGSLVLLNGVVFLKFFVKQSNGKASSFPMLGLERPKWCSLMMSSFLQDQLFIDKALIIKVNIFLLSQGGVNYLSILRFSS